jgi:ribosomal protein L7/L12
VSSPIPDEKITALRELMFSGRKIEAIKLYREISGLGLKESKEAVEALEASLRKESPEKFSSASRGKGCLGASAVICLCTGAVVYWMSRR